MSRTPPPRDRPGRLQARGALLLFPLLALGHAACVRIGLLAARPQLLVALALLPGLTLIWALRARAWGMAALALAELGLALLLYGWVGFLHVWRLD